MTQYILNPTLQATKILILSEAKINGEVDYHLDQEHIRGAYNNIMHFFRYMFKCSENAEGLHIDGQFISMGMANEGLPCSKGRALLHH